MEPGFYTIGHSTRALDEFMPLLREYGVALVVDVRTVPRSRHVPQFSRESLTAALREHGFDYLWLPELGGLRKAVAGSTLNAGWRNGSFRGYADYMQTDSFWQGIARLEQVVPRPPALMCAEAVPWRCHRSLIADALLLRGHAVTDILGPGQARVHARTVFARVRNGRLIYPPDQDLLLEPEAGGI